MCSQRAYHFETMEQQRCGGLACGCLGFCVQDKILQSLGRGKEVTVTNDGATILKSVYVDNPAAKVLVGTSGCGLLTCLRSLPWSDKRRRHHPQVRICG